MSLWHAIVLGIIQGLTEFLPISSTAHLRVIPALLDWPDPGAAFAAVIQFGTLVAVLYYFAADIGSIARGMWTALIAGRPLATQEARLGWMIGVGTLPVVVCGLAFKQAIETQLRSLYVISATMIALALVLALAEWLTRARWRRGAASRELPQLGWMDAVIVGAAQALALVPGASRSGTTITAGLFLRMSRATAARFSFLLSLPSVFAAAVYELYKHRSDLLASHSDIAALLVATAVSGVVAYASIAFLLRYLRTHSTWVFIAYRVALGALIIALVARGVLRPLPDEPTKPNDSQVAQFASR